MKLALLFLLLGALAGGCASSGGLSTVSAKEAAAALGPATTPLAEPLAASKGKKAKHLSDKGLLKRPNHAYALGERLTFAVQYFNMTAGYATLSVTETSIESGRLCLHIQARAKTHPFFETFFTVQDTIDSYIDAQSLIPWRYEKHLHEGGYKADASYIYDQRAHQMWEPARGTHIDIEPDTQDVLSCFYWFRGLDLTPGSVASIPVADDMMKKYTLKVNVLRKEKVHTLAGDFDCVLVQPHLLSAGVFQQKGDVFIWLTDDARRIPVKIKSKIAIGSININLQDAQWVQPQ